MPKSLYFRSEGLKRRDVEQVQQKKVRAAARCGLLPSVIALDLRDPLPHLQGISPTPPCDAGGAVALAGGAFFMYLFPKIVGGWDTPPMDFSVAVWVPASSPVSAWPPNRNPSCWSICGGHRQAQRTGKHQGISSGGGRGNTPRLKRTRPRPKRPEASSPKPRMSEGAMREFQDVAPDGDV